ncbi:MAG: hypothetical protein JXB40_04665 [Candidatus Omnitrophica bacterium]|nr:hypothetical protein [Candidatus Omnitrophota bacterium]
MNRIDMEEKIRNAYDTVSSVNGEAFKDIFLMSNPVLSKTAYNNDFLHNYLNGNDPGPHSVFQVALKILMYYLKSAVHFAAYMITFVEHHLFMNKFKISRDSDELVLIDTYFVMDRIRKAEKFEEWLFPGLEDLLKKKARHYAYLPFFYSSPYAKRLPESCGVMKILKRDMVPVLAEYQLLTIGDLLRMACFIVTYPLHVASLLKKIIPDSHEKKLLRYELIDTIDQVTFHSFSRYLQGRRISGLPYRRIKVISWYENQPVHKNLYRGMRSDPSKVRIYGAQLFLHSKNYIPIIPDVNEESFGVIPDRIIANGEYYMPERSKFDYRVGPSLRYARVFNTIIRRENQKNILILLPYVEATAENIIRTFLGSKLPHDNVFVKLHPGTPLEKIRSIIPPDMVITGDDTYKLFESAKIVISAASGTLIEAASLGIAAISIKNGKRFDYDNPLIEYGRGIIWDEAFGADELARHVEKFKRAMENDAESLIAVADRYRKIFFREVTQAGIEEAFDL